MKLLEYIKGSRKGNDAYRIERKAMDDPFLADALEGLDSVEGNHFKEIEALQKQLTKKLQPKTYHFRTWSIAVSILICVSFGGYFIVQNIQKLDLFAAKSNEESVAAESAESEEIAYTEEIPDTLYIYMPEKEIRKEKVSEQEDFPMMDMQMEKMPVSIKTLPVIASAESKKTAELIEQDYKNSTLNGLLSGISTTPHVVKGKIVDQNGEPLTGVSVTQKGTNQGAVTDTDGKFSININNNNNLEARYLGFDTKEFSVNTSSPLYIAMNENTQTLDEVVVVGYGTRSKKEMASSVSSVNMKDVKPSPLMGMKAYQRYINDNIKRPTDAVCGNKKGTVILEFNVDAKGTPININVKKSVCVSMDIEAIRILQQGPKWTVGSQTAELKVKF